MMNQWEGNLFQKTKLEIDSLTLQVNSLQEIQTMRRLLPHPNVIKLFEIL
jgi:hypothetical protein